MPRRYCRHIERQPGASCRADQFPFHSYLVRVATKCRLENWARARNMARQIANHFACHILPKVLFSNLRFTSYLCLMFRFSLVTLFFAIICSDQYWQSLEDIAPLRLSPSRTPFTIEMVLLPPPCLRIGR
jgi:hypothetical protein